jgi:hypothetical protein
MKPTTDLRLFYVFTDLEDDMDYPLNAFVRAKTVHDAIEFARTMWRKGEFQVDPGEVLAHEVPPLEGPSGVILWATIPLYGEDRP